jgi:hypothetical protein
MSVFRIVVLPKDRRYLPEDKLASSVGASRVRSPPDRRLVALADSMAKAKSF